jgi:GNAT superfamily N-acetyltransferase
VTVEVRRLRDGEWAVLREVRLAALREAPYAFNSTYEDEVTHDDATWRGRLGEQAWFCAVDDARPVGVASGGRPRVPDPAVRTLRAMWVDAEHRGQRVADALVGAVAAWARADGARVLTLWALDASTRAHAFYRRVGFSPVGADQDDLASTHPAMTRYTLAL